MDQKTLAVPLLWSTVRPIRWQLVLQVSKPCTEVVSVHFYYV